MSNKTQLNNHSIKEVGVFRISLGIYLLYYYVSLVPIIFDLFGPNSMVNASLISNKLSLLFYCWNDFSIAALLGIQLMLIIFFTAGWLPKWGLVLTLVIQISFHNANPYIIHEPQQLANLFMFTFLLLPLNSSPILGASQTSYSAKQLADYKGVVRVLIVYCGVYYFLAAYKRLPDPLWIQGEAITYMLQWAPFIKDNLYTPMIIENVFFAKTANYVVLLFESTFLFLVFTRWRPVVIVLGSFIHLLIYLTMEVGSFSAIMWAWYALLLDQQTINFFKNFLRKKSIVQEAS